MRGKRPLSDGILIALFTLLITVPLVFVVYEVPSSTAAMENRLPHERPSPPRSLAELNSYPQRFEEYFSDSFGLRAHLLRLTNNLKLVASISPQRDYVVGREGWFFLSRTTLPGPDFLDQIRGAAPLPAAELDTLVRRLDKIAARLEDHGVQLLLVIAPEKSAIYPEKLPARVRRVGPGRLHQLRDALEDRPYYLDTLAPLASSKLRWPGRLLYYEKDLHWNCWGAFSVYADLIPRLESLLGRTLPVVSEEEIGFLQIVTSPGSVASWKSWWSRGTGYDDRQYQCLLPVDPSLRMWLESDGLGMTFINGEVELPESGFKGRDALQETWRSRHLGLVDGPRAVVVRDSFASYLVPFISRSFHEVVYVHYNRLEVGALSSLLEQLRPDVILLEIAERQLGDPVRAIAGKLNLGLAGLPAPGGGRAGARFLVPGGHAAVLDRP